MCSQSNQEKPHEDFSPRKMPSRYPSILCGPIASCHWFGHIPKVTREALALSQFFPSAPNAARKDERLSTWLTLSDAIRVGDARVRMLAATEIGKLIENIDHVRL